jgi:hypothetical protein
MPTRQGLPTATTFAGDESGAIQDKIQEHFQRYQSNNYVRKGDRVNAVGNDVLPSGKWSCAFHDTDGRYKHIDAHYSAVWVREGDTWKIRRATSDEGTGYWMKLDLNSKTRVWSVDRRPKRWSGCRHRPGRPHRPVNSILIRVVTDGNPGDFR